MTDVADAADVSPNGCFLVVARGSRLRVVAPTGEQRWTLGLPQSITAVRWGPGDGFRIAVLTGGGIDVVNGDRSGRHRLVGSDVVLPPVFVGTRDLAYVRARTLVVRDVDDGLVRRRTRLREPVVALVADGQTIAVAGRTRVELVGRRGRTVVPRAVRLLAARPSGSYVAVTTGGDVIVIAGTGRVDVLGPQVGAGALVVFT